MNFHALEGLDHDNSNLNINIGCKGGNGNEMVKREAG
jgi:hypothetical protein